ncbi:hypothetical protein BGZ83_002731 [Gryganskiella cystojenkinii]|nr:hypothetical protein BGZ83_002731 [Gryganskiella cystojenkinii]
MNFTHTGFSLKGLSSDEIPKILGSNKPAHCKVDKDIIPVEATTLTATELDSGFNA